MSTTRTPRNRLETQVRRLREQQGLSMIQLAVRAGIAEGTLRRIEQAESADELSGLGVGQLLKLSSALNVRPWQLWARLG